MGVGKSGFSFQNLVVDICIILSAAVFSILSSLNFLFCGMFGQPLFTLACRIYGLALSINFALNLALAAFAAVRILAGLFGKQLLSRKFDLSLLFLPALLTGSLWLLGLLFFALRG